MHSASIQEVKTNWQNALLKDRYIKTDFKVIEKNESPHVILEFKGTSTPNHFQPMHAASENLWVDIKYVRASLGETIFDKPDFNSSCAVKSFDQCQFEIHFLKFNVNLSSHFKFTNAINTGLISSSLDQKYKITGLTYCNHTKMNASFHVIHDHDTVFSITDLLKSRIDFLETLKSVLGEDIIINAGNSSIYAIEMSWIEQVDKANPQGIKELANGFGLNVDDFRRYTGLSKTLPLKLFDQQPLEKPAQPKVKYISPEKELNPSYKKQMN